MYVDTLNFVASCIKCLQAKHHHTPPATLQPTYTPRYPVQTTSTDLVGLFTNVKSVLTITDNFSRHLERFTLSDTSASKFLSAYLITVPVFGALQSF